jgi:hypothetical protein
VQGSGAGAGRGFAAQNHIKQDISRDEIKQRVFGPLGNVVVVLASRHDNKGVTVAASCVLT